MRIATLTMLGMIVPTVALAAPLDPVRWQKRVLLVFAQGQEDLRRAQLSALGNGALKRDLLVLDVPASGRMVSGTIDPIDADAVRQAYGIDTNTAFTVILVGKDGGIKLRRSTPISAAELYGTIDAMPMRRQEMGGD